MKLRCTNDKDLNPKIPCTHMCDTVHFAKTNNPVFANSGKYRSYAKPFYTSSEE